MKAMLQDAKAHWPKQPVRVRVEEQLMVLDYLPSDTEDWCYIGSYATSRPWGWYQSCTMGKAWYTPKLGDHVEVRNVCFQSHRYQSHRPLPQSPLAASLTFHRAPPDC